VRSARCSMRPLFPALAAHGHRETRHRSHLSSGLKWLRAARSTNQQTRARARALFLSPRIASRVQVGRPHGVLLVVLLSARRRCRASMCARRISLCPARVCLHVCVCVCATSNVCVGVSVSNTIHAWYRTHNYIQHTSTLTCVLSKRERVCVRERKTDRLRGTERRRQKGRKQRQTQRNRRDGQRCTQMHTSTAKR